MSVLSRLHRGRVLLRGALTSGIAVDGAEGA